MRFAHDSIMPLSPTQSGSIKAPSRIQKSFQWQLTNEQLGPYRLLKHSNKSGRSTKLNSDKTRSCTHAPKSPRSNSLKWEYRRVGLLTLALFFGWWSRSGCFFLYYSFVTMCRPQPMIHYNKCIPQNRISIYVQKRSNTNVRWTSSNEQVSDARSSSQSDTRRNGKEKLWTTKIECLRGLVHIR